MENKAVFSTIGKHFEGKGFDKVLPDTWANDCLEVEVKENGFGVLFLSIWNIEIITELIYKFPLSNDELELNAILQTIKI
jgi:hypothetical protein